MKKENQNLKDSKLWKQLIAQNVPLPGSYPDKYIRKSTGEVHVYEPMAIGGPRPGPGNRPNS